MDTFALHLVVDDVPRSISWYQDALGGAVTRILRLPDGTVATAELDIGGLPIALAAPVPGTTLATPKSTMTSVAAYRLAVPDADAAMAAALEAGATLSAPVQDAFWGVRTGEVLDPSGHRWAFDQRLRDVPIAELEARLAELVSPS
jgi:PhnB protein